MRVLVIIVALAVAWALSSAGVFVRYGGKPYSYDEEDDSSYSTEAAQKIWGKDFDSDYKHYKTDFFIMTVEPRLFQTSITTKKLIRTEFHQEKSQ